MLKQVIALSLSCILLNSCSRKESSVNDIEQPGSSEQVEQRALKLSSESMKKHNPLLPSLEKKLWNKMIDAEKKALSGDPEGRRDFISLAKEITDRHPFEEDKQRAVLGGVVWDKVGNFLELDAVVKFPHNDDYVELVLCNKYGRKHETLFLTEVRPLHLEIMMHFSSCRNEGEPTKFNIFIALPGDKEIALESFIKSENGKGISETINFYFSGSPYSDDTYEPDVNGDHILFWQRHDAVLQCSDQEIKSGNRKILVNRDSLIPENTPVKLRLKRAK